MPSLPDFFEWPEIDGVPRAFLCQLDLREIRGESIISDLPSTGILYFFFDWESWLHVAYVDVSTARCTPSTPPKNLDEKARYPERFVRFAEIESYPSCDNDRINALEMNQRQIDEYCDRILENEGSSHKLFGFPDPIQNDDMDLECALRFNDVWNEGASLNDESILKEFEEQKNDWTILLELGAFDDAELIWGDAGKLYVWIRKEDLKALRFENCQAMQQCF
jgi:uncharacterized protein YwqG